GVTRRNQCSDLIEDTELDEVILLLHKQDRLERRLLHQIGKIHVCGYVLLANPDIGILHSLMLPVTHERSIRVCEELVVEVAIIDSQMIAAGERRGDAAKPFARLYVDLRLLAFREWSFDRYLERT